MYYLLIIQIGGCTINSSYFAVLIFFPLKQGITGGSGNILANVRVLY